MTDPHEHDYWRTPSGALECACGQTRRPITQPDEEKESEK